MNTKWYKVLSQDLPCEVPEEPTKAKSSFNPGFSEFSEHPSGMGKNQ